jgi:Protein of unknown function (DUF3738)
MVWEATGVTMSELAKFLPLDHETLDRTGGEGRFDFVLRYLREGCPRRAPTPRSSLGPKSLPPSVSRLG